MSMKSSEPLPDLRVRRTHKLLWDALMAELSERRLEDLTVTDLCERAMVHRTTFYKHYADIYALLERGMHQMLDAVMVDGQHLPPSAYSVAHPPPYFVRLFEQAAQHRPFYQAMVCGTGNGRFQQLLRDYIAAVASANLRAAPRTGLSMEMAVSMHAHYVAGATVSLLAWWLERDMPLSPLQMAQYLLQPHGAAATPG
jgi:AcrR family transcriptional regulator